MHIFYDQLSCTRNSIKNGAMFPPSIEGVVLRAGSYPICVVMLVRFDKVISTFVLNMM